MERSTKPTVLVTGCNGYIGSWITCKLLNGDQYNVCGTLRSITTEKTKLLKDAFGALYDKLALFPAEMTSPDSVENAIKNAKPDFVIHTASPHKFDPPKDEDEWILPAKIGTEAVLKYSLKHGVKRVVQTSSCAAIEDWTKGDIEVDESHWHDPDGISDVNHKAKFIAEKLVWDFYDNLSEQQKEGFEVVTINPSFVFGPLKVNQESSAQAVITRIVDRTYTGFVPAHMNTVDVRDVADAHIRALTAEANRRYIISKDIYFIQEIVDTLAEKCKNYGYDVYCHLDLPFTLWAISLIDDTVDFWYKKWDTKCKMNNEASKEILKMDYMSEQTTLHDMVDTLIEFEFLENKSKN